VFSSCAAWTLTSSAGSLSLGAPSSSPRRTASPTGTPSSSCPCARSATAALNSSQYRPTMTATTESLTALGPAAPVARARRPPMPDALAGAGEPLMRRSESTWAERARANVWRSERRMAERWGSSGGQGGKWAAEDEGPVEGDDEPTRMDESDSVRRSIERRAIGAGEVGSSRAWRKFCRRKASQLRRPRQREGYNKRERSRYAPSYTRSPARAPSSTAHRRRRAASARPARPRPRRSPSSPRHSRPPHCASSRLSPSDADPAPGLWRRRRRRRTRRRREGRARGTSGARRTGRGRRARPRRCRRGRATQSGREPRAAGAASGQRSSGRGRGRVSLGFVRTPPPSESMSEVRQDARRTGRWPSGRG